ncbi:hypothetical protein SNEBB_008684 [Seison nebaliae]|nr:hypothetical protein SNEBB_008684 [Seison nebaliae]
MRKNMQTQFIDIQQRIIIHYDITSIVTLGGSGCLFEWENVWGNRYDSNQLSQRNRTRKTNWKSTRPKSNWNKKKRKTKGIICIWSEESLNGFLCDGRILINYELSTNLLNGELESLRQLTNVGARRIGNKRQTKSEKKEGIWNIIDKINRPVNGSAQAARRSSFRRNSFDVRWPKTKNQLAYLNEIWGRKNCSVFPFISNFHHLLHHFADWKSKVERTFTHHLIERLHIIFRFFSIILHPLTNIAIHLIECHHLFTSIILLLLPSSTSTAAASPKDPNRNNFPTTSSNNLTYYPIPIHQQSVKMSYRGILKSKQPQYHKTSTQLLNSNVTNQTLLMLISNPSSYPFHSTSQTSTMMDRPLISLTQAIVMCTVLAPIAALFIVILICFIVGLSKYYLQKKYEFCQCKPKNVLPTSNSNGLTDPDIQSSNLINSTKVLNDCFDIYHFSQSYLPMLNEPQLQTDHKDRSQTRPTFNQSTSQTQLQKQEKQQQQQLDNSEEYQDDHHRKHKHRYKYGGKDDNSLLYHSLGIYSKVSKKNNRKKSKLPLSRQLSKNNSDLQSEINFLKENRSEETTTESSTHSSSILCLQAKNSLDTYTASNSISNRSISPFEKENIKVKNFNQNNRSRSTQKRVQPIPINNSSNKDDSNKWQTTTANAGRYPSPDTSQISEMIRTTNSMKRTYHHNDSNNQRNKLNKKFPMQKNESINELKNSKIDI